MVTVRFGAFVLDPHARQLRRGRDELHLSPKAFDLLALLLERRPAVVDKAALRQRLWPDVHVVDAGLTNLMAEIRSVLKDDDAGSPIVRTVHGVGYAFPGEAVEESAPPAPDSARATPYWLVWNDRPIVLRPGDHIIGRDASCAVWIDAGGVSRRHARVHVPADGDKSGVTIEDLDSTNGTYVQGRKITGAKRVADGDRIRLGQATVIFRAWKASDSPTKRVKGPRGKS